MRAGPVILGIAIVLGGLYWLKQAGSPLAGSCIHRQEDRNWSFLTFYNKCSSNINVVFCNKMAVGEIGKLFGFETGEWDCRRYNVRPGQSFATVKWVNEQSSVASHLLSTSRYQVAACKTPHRPRFTEGTSYVCEKN